MRISGHSCWPFLIGALLVTALASLPPSALRYDTSTSEEIAMESIDSDILKVANAKSRRLRELVRAPEILVMPGAYDVLSALLFERMGFKAIQGTSGGIAASLGYPDGEVMNRDEFIRVSGSFAAAVA